MRREWIEIPMSYRYVRVDGGLPPCGGSGLKCKSGIKWYNHQTVSLHAEGVD